MSLQLIDVREAPRTSVPWIYLSSLSFFLAGAVFYLALARLLPYTELGAVVILAAVASLMTVVFSFGIGPGFKHFLSFYLGRSETATLRALVRSALFFAIVLSVAAASATLALSTGLSDLFFHTRAYSGAIAIVSVYAGLLTANSILQSVLLGLQKFAIYSMVYITWSVATYGLALGLLLVRPRVDSVVTGWALGSALGCALYVVVILRTTRHGSGAGTLLGGVAPPHLYRSFFAYSLPLFVSSVLATGALYVDRLVLASVATLASVGVYNYALLIVTASAVVIGPFGTILIPKASMSFGQRNEAEIRSLTQRGITLIALVYVPVGLGLAALSPFLLRYLAGPGFVSASVPLIVLLVISAVFVPYQILSSIAAGTRRTMAFVWAAGFALVTNLALCIALVPRLGMTGAAIGNSSMIWIPFLVFYLELRNSGFVSFDLASLARVWLGACAMSLAVGVPLWFLGYPPVFVPIFVLIGIVCLAVLLRLMGAITAETATTLLQVLPRRLHGLRHAIYWLAPSYRVEETRPVDRMDPVYEP